MELRQIRYFVAVADKGNFARAAEDLRIAQSGLSQQIMVLERSLGARLFDRSVRPVKLTSEGEVFLEHAQRILRLADNAAERVRVRADSGPEILRVGASPLGIAPVADELLRQAETLPDVELRRQLDIAPHNIAALNRREIDAMISYVPYDSPESPRYLHLGSVELVLAIPEGNRLASFERVPRDALAKEPFLVGPQEVNPRLFDCMFSLLFGQPEPPDPVRLSSFGSRLQLAAEGRGLAGIFVPAEPIFSLPGLVYRRLEDPIPTFDYGLLWFDDRMSPAQEAFLELASKVAAEAPEACTEQLLAQALRAG
jgi:DNA-binding transcriptional LysR family regulator